MKNKHLTFEERLIIQECLAHGMPFKAIAKRVGKDPSTISKEVQKRIHIHRNSHVKTEEICPLLRKAPFVCNGCPKKSYASCHYPRAQYIARKAQECYETTLVESREGISLNKESFYLTEKIISDGIERGQRVYHILKTHNLPISQSTVYRHINRNYYEVKRIDLPRAVKFKPRRKHSIEKVPSCVRKNRTFADFTALLEENNYLPYVEMDTVIGRIGGKTLLTLQFVHTSFMVGILLENKTSDEVTSKLNELKYKLKKAGFSFGQLFPVMLTDNGGEFSKVLAIESPIEGDSATKVFFCDPNMPSQKPHVEKNHTLFRDIVPKGSSFDGFTQETIDLIFSHVNNVKRAAFNGKSAYDLFSFSYSEQLATLLGISYISPENVLQSPRLLR